MISSAMTLIVLNNSGHNFDWRISLFLLIISSSFLLYAIWHCWGSYVTIIVFLTCMIITMLYGIDSHNTAIEEYVYALQQRN